MQESVEIVNGVFMGGCNAAHTAVREGHKKAEDFKSVAGMPVVVHAVLSREPCTADGLFMRCLQVACTLCWLGPRAASGGV